MVWHGIIFCPAMTHQASKRKYERYYTEAPLWMSMSSLIRVVPELGLEHTTRGRIAKFGDRRPNALFVLDLPSKRRHHDSCPAPGNKLPLTANIFPVTPAVKPSICLAYCSTCLLFNIVSSLPGSVGNLNNLCHSSSGSGLCFAIALDAFSDFRFVCQAVIFACSLASCRW